MAEETDEKYKKLSQEFDTVKEYYNQIEKDLS